MSLECVELAELTDPVGVAQPAFLRPYQQQELAFLKDHPFSALWSEAGLGKTRPMLLAAQGRTLVVAPAAVRDTQVWELEADRCGIPRPRVVSYHEIARMGIAPAIELDTLLLDESQHAIHDTNWMPGLESLARDAIRVHQSTGTPMPNSPHELWGQFHLLFDDEYDFKYKWPWMEQWFIVTPSRHNAKARDISRALANCNHKGEEAEHCEHWLAFHAANIEGRAIRHLRDDVLSDLPPLSGADTPLWAPMTALQKRVYKSIKKDLLALIPEEGIAIEALTKVESFSMLHRLSSGLSVLDPDADPKDKESGKFALFAELLHQRTRPTLATVWFKNTAAAIVRQCERQGKSYVTMGSKTTPKQRALRVQAFGRGEYDVMVASVGVIKEGVDGLQHGSDEAIMVERSWRYGDNEQTLRRLHRLGQIYPVTARQLVTKASVDSYQWDAIADKKRDVNRALRPVEVASMI